jgi:hypothetical protein
MEGRNHTPSPLPQFDNSTPPLDSAAASPVRDSCTDHTEVDPLCLPNPHLVPLTPPSPPLSIPPSPPPSAPLAAGPHLGDLTHQLRREQIAEEIPDRDRTGQRTSGHTPSISDPGQQSPIDIDPILFATLCCHPSAVPELPLPGGPGVVSTLHSALRTDAPRTPSTSDAGAQHISEKSRGRPHDTSSILGQLQPPPSALARRLPCESPHIPTDAEKNMARHRIARRVVQISALEMRISDLEATFEAESIEKYAAIMDHFNSRILAIQKEVADRLNDALSQAPESGSCC